jgi:hypothetical protein
MGEGLNFVSNRSPQLKGGCAANSAEALGARRKINCRNQTQVI